MRGLTVGCADFLLACSIIFSTGDLTKVALLFKPGSVIKTINYLRCVVREMVVTYHALMNNVWSLF